MGSNHVYANTFEISSKKSSVKSVAAPADVCHTPPPPPATPKIGIPIPYPNFGKQATLTKGTTSVFIKKKPVSRKNISFYKKSTGNELATTQFKKGLISGEIKGKTFASSYSFNVFVESYNVVRMGDTSKHNAG